MSSKMEKAHERMDQFFDKRADSYEDHMLQDESNYKYYQMISDPINKTDQKISILDLGCGSGLELAGIFKKAPNAMITGIDLSQKLMEKLMENYHEFADQITLINSSYLTFPFSEKTHDYVISSMTMHHFVYDDKIKLYEMIRKTLKDGGIYIEGDYITDQEKEQQYLQKYQQIMNSLPEEKANLYHIDIPFSIETQKRLFFEAGFTEVKVFWEKEKAAIFVVK